MNSLVYLFVPGINLDKMNKALMSTADAVIIDLEDAVHPAEKESARARIKYALQHHPNPKMKTLIRMNTVQSPWFEDDLKFLSEIKIDAVMLPKADDPLSIQQITMHFPEMEVVPLIETARGVLRAEEIIRLNRQVSRLAFGSVDYAGDIGVEWTKEGIERHTAMSLLVLASRAAGAEPPIDAVFPIIDDEDSFIRDTIKGKSMGFFGKLVIHPKHIDWVNKAYQPTLEQLERSRRIVAAFESHGEQAAFSLDGKLIDLPVYYQAKRILMFEELRKKS